MSLANGTRLGPYEITAQLGAGGMGEVWRATDTSLGRDVAIKVLPDTFSQDPERLARFEREARTLASLNHPNIAAIYGLEKTDTGRALVMELVEGPTLADRIAEGPIPFADAHPLAKQIADAMEAAHEQGIIHRDLKPANIKVRPDGTVKVLDFGLAKALDAAGSMSAGATASPTITSPALATGAGVLLGTAAYMSPEQARGKPADKRADIWAFGCVFYEMLAGTRAFGGDDVTDTIASVVKSDPEWSALPAEVPQSVRTILKRCLDKDRRKRIADIAVVLFVLSELSSAAASQTPGGATAATAPARPGDDHGLTPTWIRVATHALAVLLAAAATGTAVWYGTRPPAPRVARFAISPTGAAAVTAISNDREMALTPDGSRIIYVGNNGTQLFVRPLDQIEVSPLAGGVPRGPFLSPDGQWIGFFEGMGVGSTIKKVTITGGPAVDLHTFTAGQRAGGTWGEDGTIVFATSDRQSGLWQLPAGGGDATELTKPDFERGEGDHLWPEFLPGGRAVLFTIVPAKGGIETAQVAVLDLATGARKTLVQGGSHAHYVPSGHLVYGAAGTLRAVAFDLDRLEAIGTPVPVLSQIRTTTTGAANFAVARDGTLVYVVDAERSSAGPTTQRTLAWVDRQGREEAIAAPPRFYSQIRLSPDSQLAAVSVADQQDDIWIWSFGSQTLTRLTVNPAVDRHPAWTPDGRHVVFSSGTAEGGPMLFLFRQAWNGTGSPESLVEQGVAASFQSVSLASDRLAVISTGGFNSTDIATLTLDKDRRLQRLVATPFIERNAEVSPDGRWLAYEANDSGQFQVYVRPFPDVNSGRWQVSTGAGIKPLWTRNSQELFFVTSADTLMGVRVQPGPSWKASTPAPVLEGRYQYAGQGRSYDISADGKRFLMIKPDPSEQADVFGLTTPTGTVARASEEGFIVVQHWTEELKRMVPPR